MEDKYGCNLHDEKWSTLVLDQDPHIVENAHGDYFQAGAQAAITCTYRTNPDSYGDDIKGFHQSIEKAVKVAKSAASKHSDETRLIIGSVGPYGQGQRDGSTFTGVYPKIDQLKTLNEKEAAYIAFHKEKIDALLDHPDVDVIGLETIPRIDESVALAKYFCEQNKKPFYICFACRSDGKSTGFGEPIGNIVTALQPYFDHPAFWAFGLNCVDPSAVSPLLTGINA